MLYRFDGRTPKTGNDTYIGEGAIIIGDVRIADCCYIGHGVVLRGDYGTIEIGYGAAIEEGVVIHAPPGEICKIGKKITVGHGAIVHAASIGDLSVIGMGAILSIHAEIGENTIIAEGSVVKMRQTIPGGVVAGGNPARVIRKIAKKDTEYWGMAKQLYIDLAKKYIDCGVEKI